MSQSVVDDVKKALYGQFDHHEKFGCVCVSLYRVGEVPKIWVGDSPIPLGLRGMVDPKHASSIGGLSCRIWSILGLVEPWSQTNLFILLLL